MTLGQHGSHGNLWNGVQAEGDDASSDAFSMGYGASLHVFGAAEGAYMMRLQFSQDGEHWYNGPRVEPDDDGHFEMREAEVQARFVRLQALRGPEFSTADEGRESMNLTATLVAKTTA